MRSLIMQNPGDKCLGHTSYSKPDPITNQLWWISSAGQVSQSSLSQNLNMDLNSSGHFPFETAQFGYNLKSHDPSSAHVNGFEDVEEKMDNDNAKSVLSLGGCELVYSIPKSDHPQSTACFYPHSNAYVGGVMAAYGSNSILPQMVSIASSGRAQVVLDLREDGPIYVNAKQYHGILRRRQLRAKLEAENKLVRGRQPYLHESRHRHAMKRIRGAGGRFLNTKQLMQQQQAGSYQQMKSSLPSSEAKKSSTFPLLELTAGIVQHNNVSSSSASENSSGSEVTDVSNRNDMFQLLPDHLNFAEFRSHVGGMHNGVGVMYNG